MPIQFTIVGKPTPMPRFAYVNLGARVTVSWPFAIRTNRAPANGTKRAPHWYNRDDTNSHEEDPMTEQQTLSRIESAAALALFSFVFLGSEFFFDTRMGAFVAASDVTLAQNLILGVSALGFAAFAGSRKIPPGRARAIGGIIVTAGACACLGAIPAAPTAGSAFTFGCIAFFLLGMMGGAAHWALARTLCGDATLSRTVGVGYAGGIALQFASNQLLSSEAASAAALCIGCFALVAILFAMSANAGASSCKPECEGAIDDRSQVPPIPKSPQPLKGALWSIVLVVSLSCLFSTLDNVATIANAEGSLSIEQWPRLFLAASGLAAGFLFDLHGGKHRSIIMFCIAILSTCSLLATEAGMGPIWGLIVFYLGSGFFVVFFTTEFLTLAPRMRIPELWAGAGRTANNLCACLLSSASLALVRTGNTALIMVAALALFALIAVCFTLSRKDTLVMAKSTARTAGEAAAFASPADSTKEAAAARDEEPAFATPFAPITDDEARLSAFAERFGMTPREKDVLRTVMADERPLKQVADELGISLRMVQKHLASIYRKTKTSTRAGLAKKYWE